MLKCPPVMSNSRRALPTSLRRCGQFDKLPPNTGRSLPCHNHVVCGALMTRQPAAACRARQAQPQAAALVALPAARVATRLVSLQYRYRYRYCCSDSRHRHYRYDSLTHARGMPSERARTALAHSVLQRGKLTMTSQGTTTRGARKIQHARKFQHARHHQWSTTRRAIHPTLLPCHCCLTCNIQHGACERVHRFSAPAATPHPVLCCGRGTRGRPVIRVCCSTAAAPVLPK